MQRAWISGRAIVVLGLTVAAAACESTPLLVPTDGQILISADPVEAEERAADSSGDTLFSTIDATVLSASGQVLPGVQVTFTRSGGRLCLSEASCLQPQDGPLTLETDANGRARVILGVTDTDPAAVDVIARSGTKEATVNVTNPIGEALPLSVTITVPSVPSAVDCEFDAAQDCVYSLTTSFQAVVANSTSPITCYRWGLVTSGQANPAPQTGTNPTFSPPAFTIPQQVDVAVSVTNEGGTCDANTVFEATGTRTIHVCDSANLPPNAVIDNPPLNTLPLSNGSVTFNLTANGTTDPNGTPAAQLSYRWDCGNGSNPTGISVSCTYTTAGQKTVNLTVFDVVTSEAECARRDAANPLTLTVIP